MKMFAFMIWLLTANDVIAQKQVDILSSLSLVSEPKDLFFLNTMSAKLSCSATGYPLPKIEWLNAKGLPIASVMNLTTASSAGELIFHPFQLDNYREDIHNSKYRCKISNRVGIILSRMVQVQVAFDLPYSPMVHHQWTSVGETAIFKCQIPNNVANFIEVAEWLINYPGKSEPERISLGRSQNSFYVCNTGELIITKVIEEHKDYLFSCLARNIFSNATMRNTPGRLFVGEEGETQLEPRKMVYPINQVVDPGDSFILNCQSAGIFHYAWYKESQSLKLDSDHIKQLSGGTIQISNAQQADTGKYTCIVFNDVYKSQHSAEVHMKVPIEFIKTPKNVFANTGETATFTCSVTNSQNSVLQWIKDGALLQRNNRITVSREELKVSHVNKADEGIYQCAVETTYGGVQATSRLVVDGMSPQIDLTPSSKTLNQGSLLTLTCKCSGKPTPSILWYFDGVAFRENSNVTTRSDNGILTSVLNILSVKTMDSGIYTCEVENYVGLMKTSSDIHVEGFPSIVGFTEKVYGITKRPLYIDCRGKGYPTVVYQWYKDRQKIPADNKISVFANGTLLVKRFSNKFNGEYWCIVANKHGSFKKIAQVEILDPPQILPFTLHSVLIGDRVEFLCTLTRGSQIGLNYSWYKDGVRLNANGFSRTLLIPQVKASDRGRYKCVATNYAGMDSYADDFVVYEEPVFLLVPKNTAVLEGQPISQHCSATGFPLPQITWYRKINDNLKLLLLNQRIKQFPNGTLHLTHTNITDNGTYVCQATFFDKTIVPDPISKEISVEIRVPPNVINSSSYEARERKLRPLKLFCLSSGTLRLTLKWFKNNALITNKENGFTIKQSLNMVHLPPRLESTLTINSLSHDYNGDYKCVAANLFGISEKKFKVFVEEEPGKPSTISLVKATSRSLLLAWEAGYNGNSPITSYRIEMKETLATWQESKFFITKESTEYEVEGLKPGWAYSFRISAMNRHGISNKSGEMSFTTKEEAPSGPPLNVTVMATAKDQLFVSWEAPLHILQNGVISGYRIYYIPTLRRTVAQLSQTTLLRTSIILNDLLQFTSYRVTVSAMTFMGEGPTSLPFSATTFEGVPSVAPLSVQSDAVTSQTILVSWKTIPEAALNGVLRGYKVKYTDVEKQLTFTKLVLNSLQTQLNDLRKYTSYQIGVLAYTNAGDGVMSHYQFITTKEDVPGVPTSFNARPASPSEISISWGEPIERNGVITEYILYYKDLSQQHIVYPVLLKAEERSHTLQNLMFGRRYLVWMTAKTSAGEGKETPSITTSPKDQVPSKIITPPRWTSVAKMGSDVTLPCAAVGHPKPVITWYKENQSVPRKRKRFMATDQPYMLFNVQEVDQGAYNCTAMNKYGSDWNVVNLIIQVPPKTPHFIDVKVLKKRSLNITWLPGEDGNSPITNYRVWYAISKRDRGWNKMVAKKPWCVLHNVTAVYFKVASENDIGVGFFSQTLKFTRTGDVVSKSSETIRFAIVAKPRGDESTVGKLMQPFLIALVVLATVLLVLLFVASWDRTERRIKKPACSRLWCTCKKDRNFNIDPYGEPEMPWPWNITNNGKNDYDFVTDSLFNLSDEKVELQVKCPAKNKSRLKALASKKGKNVTSCSSFDFQPAVMYQAAKCTKQTNENIYSSIGTCKNTKENRGYSISDPHLKACDPRETSSTKLLPEDSSEEFSLDTSLLKAVDSSETTGDSSSGTLSYPRVKSHVASDIPRALLRAMSPSKRKLNKNKRRSADSMVFKTLEDIEEKYVLDTNPLPSPLVLNPKREFFEQASYDSIISTCSSSVGELKKAYDFGQKYGLQENPIPMYQSDDEDEFEAHDKLLDALQFSGMPCDLNDTSLQIPLPVRLGGEEKNNIDLGDTLLEQSLV